jgi:gamma-glutamyltranspeptidase / glutathione hydrolase
MARAAAAAAGGAGAAVDRLPFRHAHAVTVPGVAAAWSDLCARFGRRPLADALAPAIEIAERGFPVAPQAAAWWKMGAERQLTGRRHARDLLPEGRPPEPGQVVRLPVMARSLRELAEGGKAAFYTGRIAEAIVAEVRAEGGVLGLEDLAAHASEWVEPIGLEYRGARVWECPPNGHGLAALVALNIARHLDLAAAPAGGAARMHLLIECMRLAFAETSWHVTDPAFYRAPVTELLSDAWGRERARLVDPGRALSHVERSGVAPVAGNDTVYFCAVDEAGNACSFINSTFLGFGTGIVPEGCGFSLQNRGAGFRLDPAHPNRLEPRKRPYHTIIPAMATRQADGALLAAFGVMGGMMQPQGHLQVASALLDDDLDPQAAVDQPRFQVFDGEPDGVVLVEDAPDGALARGLAAAGHRVQTVTGSERYVFGLGQVIMRREAGGDAVLWAGSDPRGDGCALGTW